MIPQNRINDVAVESMLLLDGEVTISYYLPEWDECKMLTVPADKYEKHLSEIEALTWSFPVINGNNYVDDKDGKLSIEDYFLEVDFQQLNKDAVKYIQLHHTQK